MSTYYLSMLVGQFCVRPWLVIICLFPQQQAGFYVLGYCGLGKKVWSGPSFYTQKGKWKCVKGPGYAPSFHNCQNNPIIRALKEPTN